MMKIAMVLAVGVSLATGHAWAVEAELKQSFKTRRSITVNTPVYEDGVLVESKSKRKDRWGGETRLRVLFDTPLDGIKPYLQLGYERLESEVTQSSLAGTEFEDKSYDETVVNQFVGGGIKYGIKDFLWAQKFKFDLRYNYFLDIDTDRDLKGAYASPLDGDTEAYEWKFKIKSRYALASESWQLQPQIESDYIRIKAWDNNSDASDRQLEVEGAAVESRLLVTWLTPVDNLELSLGPEWVYERGGEKDPINGWSHDSNSLTLAAFMGSYEWEKTNLEFEVWAWHQLDDEKKGENNLQFKIDWKFW